MVYRFEVWGLWALGLTGLGFRATPSKPAVIAKRESNVFPSVMSQEPSASI